MMLGVELAERIADIGIQRIDGALLARELLFGADQLLAVECEAELVELARQDIGVLVDLVEGQPVFPAIERFRPDQRDEARDGARVECIELLLLAEEQQRADALSPAGAPDRGEDEPAPKSASGSRVADFSGPASLLELINQSFEVMQTSLAQYKIAGYPPDILINVPKRACRFFEFYKAPELIMLGRQVARDTLERYERER